MSDIVKKQPSLNSKKGRQIALKFKLEEIDNRLKELGVSELNYKLGTSISNPETTQNTINIMTSSDINLMFRMLATYKNMLSFHKDFCKKHNISNQPLLNNQTLSVADIIHDLELRVIYLSNSVEINKLTQIRQELLPFIDEESKFINALKKVDDILKS